MRIGIAQIDGKWPNLALMKLSGWHKAQGDDVAIANALERYDRVYASKVFTTTPDWETYPIADEIIRGGTGFDMHVTLPDEVERIMPDYDLFNVKRAMGFTTRGCVRKCKFCVVPTKEGLIHRHSPISEFWNGQKEVCIMDNNLTAMEEVLIEDCEFIRDHNLTVDFNQGLDARLLNDRMAQALATVRHAGRIHFAWDSMAIEPAVLNGLAIMAKYVRPSMLTVYVLIGFDTTPEEDLYRVTELHKRGYESFVMPYDRTSEYQRRFARWCNLKPVFKTVKWEDYR